MHHAIKHQEAGADLWKAEGWCNKTTSACGAYTLLGGYKNFAGGEVKKGVVVPYTRKVESAGQLHKVAVEMHFAAFHKLGCEPTPPQPLSASHAQLTPAD